MKALKIKKLYVTFALIVLSLCGLMVTRKYYEFWKRKNNGAPPKVSDSPNAAINQSDFHLGTGRLAEIGNLVQVHYEAKYLDPNTNKEVLFDSTRRKTQPLKFKVGAGQTLVGLDIGVAGMKQGGRRRIMIPPHLGYGNKGAGGGLVPPNATLIFELELVSVEASQ